MADIDEPVVFDVLRKRSWLLALLRDEPQDKPELVDDAEVSRSTIDRALREFERAELITRTDRGFQPTLAGLLALEEYEQFMQRLEGVSESRSVLECLPTDSPLDTAFLQDADVVLPGPETPMEPLVALEEPLFEADEVRALGPFILPRYVEKFGDHVVNHGMTAEFILEDGVVDRLASTCAGLLEEMLDTEKLSIQRSDGSLPFALFITDTGIAAMIVYDGTTIRGVIMNDCPAAVEWARTTYETYRSDASLVHDPSA